MPTTAGAEAQFAPQAKADGDGSDSSAWVEKKKKERTPQVKDGIDIRLKVVRAQLEYVLTGKWLASTQTHVLIDLFSQRPPVVPTAHCCANGDFVMLLAGIRREKYKNGEKSPRWPCPGTSRVYPNGSACGGYVSRKPIVQLNHVYPAVSICLFF